MQDKDEATLAAVRTAAGFTGSLASVQLPSNHYHAWLELHIEQGPLLEREGIPIGIVTSIAAPAGYRFTITGFGGHAGALLMPDRKDALCAAAELILSVEKNALATGAINTVATIGTCDVHPGAVNSVPSRVVLQLDIRDTDPTRRESVMQAVRQDCEELRQRRKVTITEELVNADAPAQSSPHIVKLLEETLRRTRNPLQKNGQPRLSRLPLHVPHRTHRHDLHPLSQRRKPQTGRICLAMQIPLSGYRCSPRSLLS